MTDTYPLSYGQRDPASKPVSIPDRPELTRFHSQSSRVVVVNDCIPESIYINNDIAMPA